MRRCAHCAALVGVLNRRIPLAIEKSPQPGVLLKGQEAPSMENTNGVSAEGRLGRETGQKVPKERFQVLSLDGGGILGIFTAGLLAGLERDLGRPVLDHFDLVVGT